jgi:hypothetical protein
MFVLGRERELRGMLLMHRGRRSGGLLQEISEGRMGYGTGDARTVRTSWMLRSKICEVVDRIINH